MPDMCNVLRILKPSWGPQPRAAARFRLRFIALLALFLIATSGARAQAPNTINTVAGGGVNSAIATTAYLPNPTDAVRDGLGNTYVVVPTLNTVYKITPGGQLSVYAGTGVAGFSGDGGAAASAELNFPTGLALDTQGNLFIADSSNNRIRRVDVLSGQITTYAGSGTQYNGTGFFGGYTGDGGPATSALLNLPSSIAFDSNGNLFIADVQNDVVRVVDNSLQHVINTYAGNGTVGTQGTTNGDGGPAKNAALALAFVGNSLAADSNGNLYIADTNDAVVRVVDTSASHIITTYAGSPSQASTFFGDGGAATAAGLNVPSGIRFDAAGDLFIADTGNQRVRRVDTSVTHMISTVAGNGTLCTSYTTGCGDGGAATSASLNGPSAVFIDGSQNLLVADYGTSRIRAVAPGGTPAISTFAGGGSGGLSGPATGALLASPSAVVSDSAGDLFLNSGFQVDRVDGTTHAITAYAGNAIMGPPQAGDNGPATQANLNPFAIARDPAGNVFITQSHRLVRRVDAVTQTITSYAGTAALCNTTVNPTCGDGGPATSASFGSITGVATDSQGNLYVADGRLSRVRRVDAVTHVITTYAGTGTRGYSGDNGPATSARLSIPFGLAFDSQDNLYLTDSGNNVVRKIDNTAQHNITTYAFNGLAAFGGDGGPALSASMNFPQQVAVDSNGNLFVGGGFDNVVRRIDAGDQTVITVAGDIHNLDGGFFGDGGPSTLALLSNFGVAVDGNKNVYIGDGGNNRIRSVHVAPVASVDSSLLQPFGTILAGQTSASEEVIVSNLGLDDLTITSVTAPTNFSVLNECINPVTGLSSVSPGGSSCFLLVSFSAPSNAAGGTVFSGNVTFSTNDPANPSFSLPVTGTVGALPGVTLTVTEAGLGSGRVVSSPGSINCPASSCSANFALNQSVTLTAIGNAGSVLTSWTVNGSATTCPGTGPCTVTMSQAQNVTATFGSASITVAALGNGSGTVTSSPAGINCTVTSGTTSGTCTFSGFPPGTQTVTLTATATGNSTFAGWLGFCNAGGIIGAGTGPCQFPLAVESIVTLSGAQATAVFSGPTQAFTQGQIFVGSVDGMIFVYNPDGTLAQVLNSGNLGGTIAGMNFDKTGNLYAANPTTTGVTGGTVEFFGNNGSGPTTFGTGYNSEPIGVLVDPTGNVFVGQASGQKSLLEFPGGLNQAPTGTFFPAFESGGVTYLDLLDDNASVLYTSQSASVKNFDILNNHQNPDFARNLPGGAAYALRELGDKSVLVANTSEVVRVSPSGAVIQTYNPSDAGLFYALNLNPDGQSFWTGDASSGKVYQVRISDGALLTTINTGLGFNSTSLAFSTIFGIAIFGQPPAGGADVTAAMTSSPPSVTAGNQVTYTITVKNNGPISAANVAVTDAFPAGVAFVSSGTTLGSCTGTTTVTCTLGTMTSGQSATISIVVTPTQSGTLLNTVNVTSTTPDSNTANNSASTSTSVTGTASTLTVTEMGSGAGTVKSQTGLNPAINCSTGSTTGCSAIYSTGTVVTLTAAPSAGSAFLGWLGACSGTGPCVITMNSAQGVTATFGLTATSACSAAGAAVWIGGASGDWNNSSNWSTDQVPNDTGATACITNGGAPAQVTVSSSVAVGNLVIDAGSSVTISNNQDLAVVTSILNAGQINVAANGNQTNLSMGGTVTLSGGGSVVMTVGGNGGTPVIRSDSNGSSLINFNNTISGRGQIGNANLHFTNQAAGVVNASSSGNGLLIDPTGTAVNQGTFESTGGGILQINVTVANAGGTILAGASSQVQLLNGSDIQAGTLSTGASAFLGPPISNSTILDGQTLGTLTNTGTFTIADHSDAALLGAIVNTGSIQVAANGNQTNLSMGNAVTLSGAGSVVMTVGGNGGAPVIRQDTNGSSLTNVDNTISGVGQIGNANLAFINQASGVVNATGNALLVNPTQAVNLGTFKASAGATLQTNTLVVNASGKINADGSGATVQFLSGTHIEGGTLNTLNGAAFLGVPNGNSALIDGSAQGTLTNAGVFTIADHADAELFGAINNTGTFSVAANGNETDLSTGNPVTLSGGGSVVMTVGGNGGVPVIRSDASGSSLTNVNNIISGRGQVGNTSLLFTNQPAGVVNASSSGNALLINPGGTTVNQGLFESSGGGILQIDVPVNNLSGQILGGSGSQVQLLSGTTIQGGTLSSVAGVGFFGTPNGNGTVLDGTTQGALTNAAAYTIADHGDAQLLGAITNNASFSVAANGNQTNLSMANAVTLSGGGSVVMTVGGNGGIPVVRSVANGSSLTNVDNTISGRGQLGNANLAFINRAGGTVNANSSGNGLLINPTTTTNQGLFESTGGGILQINVTVNNASGTITAGPGASQVQLSAVADIQGGVLSSATGAGFFGTVNGSSAILDGAAQGPLTNQATFTVADHADTELLGTILNSGSIVVAANGNQTNLSAVNAVTLGGGGTVSMTVGGNGGIPVIRSDSNGSSLINVNNTISGRGQIGNGNLAFVNRVGGAVNANSSGNGLLINSTTTTNQGLFESTGGGILQINVTVNNAGGTIAAGAGNSQVQFSSGANIQGGTLSSTAGAGFFGTVNGNAAILDGTAQGALTNAAQFTIGDNGDTELFGTVNNTGSFLVAANGNQTNLSVSGAVTLSGNGSVVMTIGGNGGAPVIRQDTNGSSLTNAGNSITGRGQLTVPAFTQTAGFIQIPSGISDTVSSFAVNGGIAQVDGTLTSDGGVTTQLPGVLSGTGSVPSPVSNGGVIAAGDIPAAGKLAFGGTLAQNSTGAYEVALGGLTAGTQYSQLNVSGAATLSGALNIRLINGFTPVVGNQFIILNAASVSGTFTAINAPAVPGVTWTVMYNTTNVILLASAGSSTSFTLTVTEPGSGSGTVTDNLGQINCVDTAGVVSGTCSASYVSGTIVTLTATPAAGTVFNGWSACDTTAPCSIQMSSNQATTAVFGAVVPTFSVSVNELGTGTGSVTDSLGAINCSEANGIVTGTCSASYPSGTQVILTETATSPSTFGGWGSACATSGTSTTCSLMVSSALTVSANFVPPPQSANFTFSPGTNVSQQAAFDCPSNPNPTPANPCTDPNAHAFQLQIAQVNSTVNLTVTATEVPPSQGDGLCEAGDTVANDFDCRFTQFFNYGADANNNIRTPLCYPYANGNCVHYQVYQGTPGTEPDPSTYSGLIDWQITWNNGSFAPPAPYTGSTPRLYDDPGEPFAPGTASGDVCGQPMTIDGVAQNYSCQFEFDITTSFDPGKGVDPGIGGKTKQLTDVVVAFPPATSGVLVGSNTPDSPSVAAGAPVGFTLALTNTGPGVVNGVSASDALPNVSSSPWTITSSTGPGSCSITGPVGAQLLSCSIGTLAASAGSTVHVLSGPAFPGTFVNLAEAISSNNGVTSQQVVAVAAVTVHIDASSFSSLTPSQSILGGTTSVSLSGVISAPGATTVFPANGESVSVSINGTVLPATIGANGAFSVIFPTASIPASPTPYTITYSYAGDANLTPASDTTTSLTVNAVTASFILNVTELGTGTGTVTDNTGQINCSEANGASTGTCSGSYPSGTQVTLTENASSPSTFGGWTNACASFGTQSACTLTITSGMTATANFLPPPASVPLTFAPGTNVAQQAPFDCPSNPNPSPANPCTDPNAHDLLLQIAQVSSTVNLTVTATEVPPNQFDGLCEVGNTVSNDFDCRFATFFNYGMDNNGNTIVPLCYPYANGNCVHYQVYSGTPGTEPDPTTYSGPIDWKITWNNGAFVPPPPYTGSTPRLYDDPGEPVAPGTASGDVCGQPMTIDGVPQSYSCQFEFDVTTSFDPGTGVDPGIGGKTKQLTDFVVAFPPNTSTSGQLASTSASNSTTPGNPVSFTINVANSGPGTENSVTLNDPLPNVSSSSWTFSPAYGGPGTCSITGAAGAQTLSCSFGSLAAGASFGIGVTNPSAAAGTYTNTATISAPNQQVLSVSSATIQAFATSLTALTASQTIAYGTPAVNLSGVVSAAGPLYPPAGETVSITINGSIQSALIGANGAFSLTFPTASIPASASPYAITYAFGADSAFAAVTDASTSLTVTPANQTITLNGGPSSAVYGSTFPVSASATSGLPVTITASGACSISAGTVTMTSGTGNCSLAANQPGNSNYNPAPQVTSTTMAQKATTATAVTSNAPNPSNVGQAVAVGVAVSGNGTPTGTVQVSASTGENCSATLASGVGTCSITFTTSGARTLTASYPGDGNFSASTSSGVSQTVNPAAAGTLQITPSSVDFGSVYVGLIGLKSVTLTNTGTAPISITKVSVTQANSGPREFFANPLCLPTLGPGRSCAVLLSFVPSWQQTGVQSATLVITDSAAGSPQSVPLTGTPLNPQASFSPFFLNFGTQKVGTTSSPQTVTLQNTGTTPLVIRNFSAQAPFAIAPGTTCANGQTLNPSDSCIINVTFSPKFRGPAQGALTVSDNALFGFQFVGLSGVGVSGNGDGRGDH